jgi:hypothetical protein
MNRNEGNNEIRAFEFFLVEEEMENLGIIHSHYHRDVQMGNCFACGKIGLMERLCSCRHGSFKSWTPAETCDFFYNTTFVSLYFQNRNIGCHTNITEHAVAPIIPNDLFDARPTIQDTGLVSTKYVMQLHNGHDASEEGSVRRKVLMGLIQRSYDFIIDPKDPAYHEFYNMIRTFDQVQNLINTQFDYTRFLDSFAEQSE